MEISIKWNVCRVCLRENGTGALDEMSQIFSDAKLSKQIFDCSGVIMEPNDSLPDKICRKCLTILKYAVNFRFICRNSNEYLQSVIRKTKSATSLLKLDKHRNDERLQIDEDDIIDSIFELEEKADEMADSTSEKQQAHPQKQHHTAATIKVEHEHKDEQPQSDHITIAVEYAASQNVGMSNANVEEKKSQPAWQNFGRANPNESKASDRNLIELFVEDEDHDELEDNELEEEIEESYCKKILLEKTNSLCSIEDDGYIEEADDVQRELLANSRDADEEFLNEHENAFEKPLTASEGEEDDLPQDTSRRKGTKATPSSSPDNDGDKPIVEEDSRYVYILKNCEIKQEVDSYQYSNGAFDANNDNSSTVDVIHMVEEDMDEDDEEFKTVENVEFLEEDCSEDNNTSNIVIKVKREEQPAGGSGKKVKKTGSEVLRKGYTKRRITKARKKVTDVKVYVCDICGNHFTNRSLMNYHMRIHRNEKNYECELCFKRFNAACNLTAHMRVHTGEKPYECQFCARRFADRSTHIKHERIHTNEKPFTCNVCGKSFSLSTTLRAHERVHTGEKPFRCEPCGKSFKLPHQLKAHLKTHLHKVLALEQNE